MNEFTAKKLGEVLAFAVVGKETFEKGRNALTQVFASQGVEQILKDTADHANTITALAAGAGVSEITLPKSEKTAEKLRKMQDLYVGDEWDNPTELLEWHGFFEGAALVHWKLVEGAAEAIGHEELKKLARTGIDFHQNLLSQVSIKLKEVGGKKAAAS